MTPWRISPDTLRASIRSIRLWPALALACLWVACSTPDRQVDRAMDGLLATFDRSGSPGCAVGVYRAGGVLLARGYGFAKLEHAVPITPDTVFDIASHSKQFTAFAVCLLERDGLLSLDDDVRRHVPELHDFGETITLRHLLHNTSGLRDLGDLLEVVGRGIDQPVDRDDFSMLLQSMRSLNFRPGERYMYSNTNFVLLAWVVERVDGRPFGRFLEEEVFTPLGMDRTTVREDPTAEIPRRASAYRPGNGDGFEANFSWGRATGLAGMGFIHSTVRDLALWDANFYTEKVGGVGIAEQIYTRGTLDTGDTITYASGLIAGRQRKFDAVWHGGRGGGSSELMRFPEERLTVAVLCNLAYPHADAHDLALSVAGVFPEDTLDGSEPSPPAAATTDAPDRYAGVYWVEEQVRRTTFVAGKDSLSEVFEGEAYEMESIGDGRFQDAYESIVFSTDGRSAIGTTLATGETYRLVRVPDWSPTSDETAPYVGTYVSREFGTALSVMPSGSELVLEDQRGRRILEPLRPNAFTSPGRLIEFRHNAFGEVRELLLSTDRLVDLEFVRQGPEAQNR